MKTAVKTHDANKSARIPEDHWLYHIKAEILKTDPTAQLVLYGSRARGDSTPDSDWDLLLLTEKPRFSFEEEQSVRTPLYLKELELSEVISLQILNVSDWRDKFRITPFYENVLREGIWI